MSLLVNNVYEKSLGNDRTQYNQADAVTAKLRVLFSNKGRSFKQCQRALDPNLIIINHRFRQQIGYLPRPKFIAHKLGWFLQFSCSLFPVNKARQTDRQTSPSSCGRKTSFARLLLFYPTPARDICIPSGEKMEPVSYLFVDFYPFSIFFFFISYMHQC